MTTLAIENLACRYNGKAVIEDLSLTLESNEIIALLGPSGCGKTTLLRTIAGLQRIEQGQISISNKVVSTPKKVLASEKRNVGMIFQDYALFPHLTVAQNVAFGLSKQSKDAQQQRVELMLKLVRLDPLGERFPHELSGGQQQRVAIARALAYQPDIMLLDEPFSNIDSQSRFSIMMEIRHILKEHGIPAVFVTHSKDEAFAFADKLAIFNRGKIEQIGSAQDLYLRPNSPYVASFMGKANYLTITDSTTSGVTTCLGNVGTTGEPLACNDNRLLMLRPEQIQLVAQPASRLFVRRCFFGGSHWVYQISAQNDPDFLLEVHSSEVLPVNTSVAVNVAPHHLVTFEQS